MHRITTIPSLKTNVISRIW